RQRRGDRDQQSGSGRAETPGRWKVSPHVFPLPGCPGCPWVLRGAPNRTPAVRGCEDGKHVCSVKSSWRSWVDSARVRPVPGSGGSMDLYEHMGKDLFRAHGIATPRGIVAETPDAAAAATDELGGSSVVKVQVQVGGRGKGGGVALCRSAGEARDAAARMLGSDFKRHAVTRVLVEELLPIAHEFYTSVLLDRSVGDYLWM